MNSRDPEIREDYGRTFSWLLAHTSTPFRSWLENDHGVFWINGKAGSGKSTLMKFIAENPQTLASLKLWGGGRTLATGVFYFWNSGVSMQKSQEGLLRSLLFQLLWKCPELIKGLCLPPFQGTDAITENDDFWTMQQLKRTLRAVLEQSCAAYCFCFFIDGLDEYVGEHYELVRDLSAFSRFSWVKQCVSSRPWNVFRDAYESRSERHFILQHLTEVDMEKYILGMLRGDIRFDALSKEDPRASDLVTYILGAAQGVFLWVFLVVRSLLREIAKGDGIETLEWQIWRLPTESDAYFQHMLDSTEDVSRELTARSLLIATATENLLPVRAFCYMELERNNPNLALWPTPNSPYGTYCSTLPETVRKSIDKWSRDLLEVRTEGSQQSEWENRVGFMHRTARDYLLIEETQRLLRARCGRSFEAHDLICQFELMELKCIDTRDATRRLVCARGVIRSAKNCETRAGVAKVAILREADRYTYREADRLLQDSSSDLPIYSKATRASADPSSTDMNVRGQRRHPWKSMILLLAINHGLYLYVREELSSLSKENFDRIAPWLMRPLWTLIPGFGASTDMEFIPSTKMVNTVLHEIQSRNCVHLVQAQWHYALEHASPREEWDIVLLLQTALLTYCMPLRVERR